jgi:hypothetical protein
VGNHPGLPGEADPWRVVLVQLSYWSLAALV